MFKFIVSIISFLLIVISLGCSAPEPETISVVETKIVEISTTVEVPITVEVPVTVEVTRLIEVTPKSLPIQSPVEATSTPLPTNEMLSVGQEGRDGGQIYVLKEWREATSIPHRRGGEVVAPEGGKFIVATISFLNDGLESVDIYCSFDFGRVLFDTRGRQFDDTQRAEIIAMYDIAGNTGCNDMMQPGFGSEEETIAFMIPEDAVPDYIMFWDPNEQISERKDSFGEVSAVRYLLEP